MTDLKFIKESLVEDIKRREDCDSLPKLPLGFNVNNWTPYTKEKLKKMGLEKLYFGKPSLKQKFLAWMNIIELD